jgi:hypothetical protein
MLTLLRSRQFVPSFPSLDISVPLIFAPPFPEQAGAATRVRASRTLGCALAVREGRGGMRAVRSADASSLLPPVSTPRSRTRARAPPADGDPHGAAHAEPYTALSGGSGGERCRSPWLLRSTSSPASSPGLSGFAAAASASRGAPPAASASRAAVDDDLFPFLRADAPGRTASSASIAFSEDARDTDTHDDDTDDDDDAEGATLRPATAPGGGAGARLSLSSPRSQPIAVQRPPPPPRASDPGPQVGSVGAFSWRARAAPDAAADALSGGAFMPAPWRAERRCVSDEEDDASPNDNIASVRRQPPARARAGAHTRAQACQPPLAPRARVAGARCAPADALSCFSLIWCVTFGGRQFGVLSLPPLRTLALRDSILRRTGFIESPADSPPSPALLPREAHEGA